MAAPALEAPHVPPLRVGTVRRALRFWSTRLGVGIITPLLAIAFIGPHIVPYPTTSIEGLPYAKPSASHPFGLDYLGRDGLSRFLAGGRSVVLLSFVATLLAYLMGAGVGLVAGYMRNWIDEVLMRVADVIMAFPSILLALVLVSGLGPKLWLVVVAVAVTHAPRVARIVRGATMEVAVCAYIEAAEARGERLATILVREVLPNISAPILADFGIRLTGSIIFIASLSFLGFGLQPPASDWGLMINENRSGISFQPWVVFMPVLAIGLMTIAVNLIGDGIARSLGQTLERRQVTI